MQTAREIINKLGYWECCSEMYHPSFTQCPKCGKKQNETTTRDTTEKSKNTKSKRSKLQTLGLSAQAQATMAELPHQLHIVITRHGGRKLDTDNLSGGSKQLRDAIAEVLGRKGDSEEDGLTWEYQQVPGGDKSVTIQIFDKGE